MIAFSGHWNGVSGGMDANTTTKVHELVHMGYSCKEGHGRMNRWREEVEPIG